MKTKVQFKLFKSTSPNAPSPYNGSVQLDGKWYAVGGKALARQMVKSAKEKAPDDLLKALGDPDDIDALRKALPG